MIFPREFVYGNTTGALHKYLENITFLKFAKYVEYVTYTI